MSWRAVNGNLDRDRISIFFAADDGVAIAGGGEEVWAVEDQETVIAIADQISLLERFDGTGHLVAA